MKIHASMEPSLGGFLEYVNTRNASLMPLHNLLSISTVFV